MSPLRHRSCLVRFGMSRRHNHAHKRPWPRDKGLNLGVAKMAAVKGEQQATATDAANL